MEIVTTEKLKLNYEEREALNKVLQIMEDVICFGTDEQLAEISETVHAQLKIFCKDYLYTELIN